MSKTTPIEKTPSAPRPMSAEEIERAALSDPDAQPLTSADLARMPRTPQAKIIRRALALTQEEFSARYHIPAGDAAGLGAGSGGAGPGDAGLLDADWPGSGGCAADVGWGLMPVR